MSSSVSVITTCKGRSADAIRTLKPKIDLLEEDDELIFVDWACPDKCGDLVRKGNVNDTRVRVIYVPNKVAGPFWDPGLAKNFGASQARSHHLLFLDADANPAIDMKSMLSYIRKGNSVDMAVTGEHCLDPDYSILGLPDSFEKDGQLLISQSMFVDLNGFAEGPGWGAEVYDFILRVAGRAQAQRHMNFHVASFGYDAVSVQQHGDDIRYGYCPKRWEEGNREKAYLLRSDQFERNRRRGVFRPQGDRMFGLGPNKNVYGTEYRGSSVCKVFAGDPS